MRQVTVRISTGDEITYKVTRTYVMVERFNGERGTSQKLPTKICWECLKETVRREGLDPDTTIEESVPKSGYVTAPPIVFKKIYRLWGPALKCGVCGKRTATLVFMGFLSIGEDRTIYYLSKGFDFTPKVVGRFKRRESDGVHKGI